MKKRMWVAATVEDLPKIAAEILKAFPEERIFAFHAEMGAGKTTFIKTVAAELGVEDLVVSPTFSIVNEYQTKGGESVYHFDFYRLKNVEEALDMGCYDYMESGCYCFMEWAELIETLLPEKYVLVRIQLEADGKRKFVAELKSC